MENILQRILSLKGSQSTAAFGRSVGLNQQTMDRYLKGREPPIGVIQKLCVVYSVSADWLLGLPERSGASVNAPQNSGVIAVGAGAKATVGASGRRGAPTLPNCDKCKYKQFAEVFKAIQTPD